MCGEKGEEENFRIEKEMFEWRESIRIVNPTNDESRASPDGRTKYSKESKSLYLIELCTYRVPVVLQYVLRSTSSRPQ